MNIFNLGRKYQELRKDMYDLRALVDSRLNKADKVLEDFHKYYQDFVQDHGRIVDVEKAMVDMQAAHSADIKEILERLDRPQRQKSTVRPWSMLRSAAEAGERFMKDKQGA